MKNEVKKKMMTQKHRRAVRKSLKRIERLENQAPHSSSTRIIRDSRMRSILFRSSGTMGPMISRLRQRSPRYRERQRWSSSH